MKSKLKIAMSYVTAVAVALVMAVNYQLFVFPNSFAPAGLNGIFTMLQHTLGFKLSSASILLNITVAFISYFVYGYQIEPVLLCIIYCYFSSAVRDNMSRKYESAIRCEIITENPRELCDAIIHQLHHTATRYPAEGIYSGRKKTVLICIVNPSQVTELTKLVANYSGSFVSLSPVSTVLGNFKRLDSHGKPEVQLFDGGVTNK